MPGAGVKSLDAPRAARNAAEGRPHGEDEGQLDPSPSRERVG